MTIHFGYRNPSSSFSIAFLMIPAAHRLTILCNFSSTELTIRPTTNLLRLITRIISLKQLTRISRVAARRGDITRIAVVRVDPTQRPSINSNDIVEDDMPRPGVSFTVSTRSYDFAEVLSVEVRDGHSADAVDLDDLVCGCKGSAAGDGHVAVSLESGGVLADILPPDVGDGAGAPAVDALGLVGPDDDVGDGGAVFENEDCLVLAGLFLLLADDV